MKTVDNTTNGYDRVFINGIQVYSRSVANRFLQDQIEKGVYEIRKGSISIAKGYAAQGPGYATMLRRFWEGRLIIENHN